MAFATDSVDEGGTVDVTDAGVAVTLAAGTRLLLVALAANLDPIAYTFKELSVLVSGSAPADADEIRDSYLSLEPGDSKLRTNFNARTIWLRTATGKTSSVRIETV